MDAGGPPAVRADHLTGWRDVVQSLAHDVADVPLLPRLVAGQVVLALGYASLCASLALRERMRERMREAPETHTRGTLRLARVLRRHPLLSGMVAAAGVTFVWGSLALASRTRTAPVVSAIFAYGRELRQYVPPLRSPAYAA